MVHDRVWNDGSTQLILLSPRARQLGATSAATRRQEPTPQTLCPSAPTREVFVKNADSTLQAGMQEGKPCTRSFTLAPLLDPQPCNST